MDLKLSRRNLMIGGGVASLLGLGWAAGRTKEALLVEVLRDSLPGVTFEPEGLKLFVEEYFALYYNDAKADMKLRVTAMGASLFGLRTLSKIGYVGQNIEEMRRAAVTRFCAFSDFFHAEDPTTEEITYIGESAGTPCGNPFARFDLLEEQQTIAG